MVRSQERPDHLRALAETLVAFANAEGGLVLIGMHDGAPANPGADERALNSWRQAGVDFTRPLSAPRSGRSAGLMR